MSWGFAIPRLPLTKEHGSWAVLAIPLFIGTAGAEHTSWSHMLLAVAALAAFLAYVPVQTLIARSGGRGRDSAVVRDTRFWATVLISVALSLAASLILMGEYHLLLWASVALAGFVGHSVLAKRKGKTMWADLSAVWGLSFGAPAAYMIGSDGGELQASLLWLKVFLFFGCSVVYVHMKIQATSSRLSQPTFLARLRFGWVTLVYHVVVLGIVLAIVNSGRTPALALAAYVPMAAHAVIGTIRLSSAVRFKRLGFLLLAHSVIFAVVMVIALRGPQ